VSPVLETQGLTKVFGGIAAVDGVDFAAHAGEVHGLLGENGAGKSTFVKMLAGVVRPDDGTVLYDGEPLDTANARTGRAQVRVGVIFQELSLIPDLTVAENVWIGQEPLDRLGGVSQKAMRRRTVELFGELGIAGVDPAREVRLLSVAERHLVETAKVLSSRPDVVIFDEATSALAPSETSWLIEQARALAAAGRVVLYISHRMAEIRAVADRVTVFRGGKSVGVRTREEYDEDELVGLMVGRRVERLYPPREDTATERVALRVRGLEAGRALRGADLELHEGEILGVGGLQGQGQAQLFLALYGALRATGGEIEVFGERVRIRSVRDALAAQIAIALVPEDRRNQGLLLPKSVAENLTLSVLPRLARGGVIDRAAEERFVADAIERLRIATRSPDQPVRWLSGGNQQKVVIGKMLLTQARILLLYDLTRGVDVGTKAQIFELMRKLARDGYALLFYSTDATELVNVADRIAVMLDGRVNAVLEGDELTEEDVVRAAVREAV
jgi:ribose transport system ATP-binding protein